MAYNFVRASSQIISFNNGAPSLTNVYPVTFSAWAYGTLDTVAMTIMSWVQASSGQGFRILFAGQAAGDPVRANVITDTNYISSISSPGFVINTWHNVCGVYTSSTSRTIYLDGRQGLTNTTDRTPTSLIRIIIGAYGVDNFDGNISDVAIWSAALNTDEINSLAKGFSAKKIRPQSLEFYTPLVRNVYDYSSGSSVTSNTATVSTHNRIYS